MHEMNIGSYDLNLLQALATLLELAHVSRAAERVGMSQPAMSRTLARLRRDFGDPLLVRSGGGLKRTPRAEALAEPLQAFLQQAAGLYRGAGFDPATAHRRFRAAIGDSIGAPLLAPLHTAIVADAPGCGLEIVPWPRPRDAVIASLDFAISSELDMFPGFRAAPLYDDRDVLAMRPRALPQGMAAILEEPHIAVVAVGMVEDPVDSWLSTMGLKRRIGAVVPGYLQALLLASRSDLVAILPFRLVSAWASVLGLVSVDLPVEQAPDRMMLFHPVERDADPANRWIRALVRRVTAGAATP